jgi:LysR family transcriptional regulator, hca operon transcriptional activator
LELRHLRYFLAVAEEGSFSLAAERRLHTAQPSLSRQIRDLEAEIGAPLFRRTPKGAELTPVGQAFIDHARVALLQADAALAAARKAAAPARQRFALGFLTGHEIDWLAQALQSLRQLAPNIEVTVSSLSSPELAVAVTRGELDAAFMRAEKNTALEYRTVRHERLMAVLPAGHQLAGRTELVAQDFADPSFIMPTRTAPVLRDVIDDYARAASVVLPDGIQAENVSMALSLVVSTGGITILPEYALQLMPTTVIAKPLAAPVPVIALVVGFDPGNPLALLRRFLRSLPPVAEDAAKAERQGAE